MSDTFIRNLYNGVYKSLGLPAFSGKVTGEHQLLIDQRHPILMQYDPKMEQLLLIGQVNVEEVPQSEQLKLYQHLLQASLNPLRNSGPGIGMDNQSQLLFSYFQLPRQFINVEQVCQKLAELVEWNQKLCQACGPVT